MVGVTAMLIACKVEEIYAPEIKDFVFVTDYAYTKEEILETEGAMILSFDFNLTITSPLKFLERYE
jgi:cyclin B